jgi:hypothetical protein
MKCCGNCQDPHEHSINSINSSPVIETLSKNYFADRRHPELGGTRALLILQILQGHGY